MELELTDKLKSIILILQEKIGTQLNMSAKDVKNLQIRIDNDKVVVYANEKAETQPTVKESFVTESEYV